MLEMVAVHHIFFDFIKTNLLRAKWAKRATIMAKWGQKYKIVNFEANDAFEVL